MSGRSIRHMVSLRRLPPLLAPSHCWRSSSWHLSWGFDDALSLHKWRTFDFMTSMHYRAASTRQFKIMILCHHDMPSPRRMLLYAHIFVALHDEAPISHFIICLIGRYYEAVAHAMAELTCYCVLFLFSESNGLGRRSKPRIISIMSRLLTTISPAGGGIEPCPAPISWRWYATRFIILSRWWRCDYW